MKKYIFMTLMILFAPQIFAQVKPQTQETQKISTDELKSYETKIEQLLKNSQIDKKRLFYLYMLAGRELLNYRFYDKSKEYYQKAKDLKLDESLKEYYLNLIAISIAKKDKDSINASHANAHEYFKKHSQEKSKLVDDYLLWVKVSYLDGATEKEIQKIAQGRFGHYVKMNQIIERINQKKYEAALAGINPEELKDAAIYYKIIYDVTNVLVHKRQTQKLLCQEMYQKFPDSYSYSMKICSILNDYLKTGNIRPEKIQNLEKYFSKNHQDKKFLFSAVKELR